MVSMPLRDLMSRPPYDKLLKAHNTNNIGRGEERLEYIPGITSTRVADLPMILHGPTINSKLPRVLECIKWASKAQFLLLFLQLCIYSASSAELEELAAGLRDSGLRYLWVAHSEASFFEKASGEKGIVVPRCDRLRVLCHSSVGGFRSHCGWVSTSEAVFAGVPTLTYPLVADQAPNSKLIVEDWKMGWRARSRTGEEKLVTRDEIAGLIRRFMDVESEEGKEMRRAKELCEISHLAIREGGSSNTNITIFISEISQCRTN